MLLLLVYVEEVSGMCAESSLERLTPITRSASRSALVLTPAVAGFFAALIVDSAANKGQKKTDSHNQ